jgi:membrane-bound lytic murein transglycosylase D
MGYPDALRRIIRLSLLSGVLLAGCAGLGGTEFGLGSAGPAISATSTAPSASVGGGATRAEPTPSPRSDLAIAAQPPGLAAANRASAPDQSAPLGGPIPPGSGPGALTDPGPSASPTSARSTLAHPDLWSRLRAGFALPPLATPMVEDKERFYLANREALTRMFTRGARYLHFIVEEVERRGLPTELALLPFVESAMNPVALSSAQAAGLWQFIPSTGRHYNLAQNWWVDNRRDVVKSTHAALDYLQRIHEMHDQDWFLALASYNWGEGAVGRAVKANRARGGPGDYLSLSMPNETRHYVPKLMALRNIIARADELGLVLPAIPNRPYFVTLAKTRPIDLKLAAEYAGMSVEDFVALNPAHNRPVIAASRNNLIKIPADRLEAFQAAIERHERSGRPMASWQPYTLKKGESVEEVARRGNVSASDLMKANGLKATARILPGSRMLAPQAEVEDEEQVEAFQGPRVYESVSTSAVYHRVQRNDSLASIARNYGISKEQLAEWNGGVKTVKPGTSLLVRPAGQHTVLTTETGEKRVVSRLMSRIGEETREAVSATRDAVVAAGGAVMRKLPAQGSSAASASRTTREPRPVKAKPPQNPQPKKASSNSRV